MIRNAIIRHRRDTAANWTSVNPVLEDGQVGYETDTGLSKLGDGVTAWNSLAYTAAPAASHTHGTPSFFGTNASGTFSSNATGLSLSVSAGAGGGGVAASAGTQLQTSGTMVFSNSNGITFGMSNSSVITASHNALTTAALSDHSHGNPTLALTNLSGTTASNSAGLTLSLSAAAPSGGIAAAAGTQTQTSGTLAFVNSNGITFGMSNSSQITASHNGLTTAMASNRGSDFVQATAAFAGTSASGTIASNGISISIGPYLTTAMQSNAATISNIRVSAGTTSNLLSAMTFSNANGITFGLNASTLTASHNGLTTARASNDGLGLNTAGSNITWTANSAGVSIDARGYAGTVTGATNASVTVNSNGVSVSVGPYLTTARASNDAIGLATAQSNVTWTANSAGLSLDARGYAGTGTSATNASITLNSNGLAISVAAPGGGGAINVSAGTTSGNLQTVQFDNSNGISFGLNGSTITASHNGLTTAALSNHSHGDPTLALTNLAGTAASNSAGFTLSLNNTDDHFSAWSLVGNTAGTNSTVLTTEGALYFSGGPNITLSGNSNTIVISAAAPGGGGGVTFNGHDPYENLLMTTLAHRQASLKMDYMRVRDAFQFDVLLLPFNFTQATNSTLTVGNSVSFGLFTKTGSTLSQLTSWSGTFSINGSGTASSAQNSGIRLATFPATGTITQGDYYLGILWSTSTAGANATLGHVIVQNASTIFSGLIGTTNNATQMYKLGQGEMTVSTAAMPSSVAITNLRGQNSSHFRPQVVMFTSNYFI